MYFLLCTEDYGPVEGESAPVIFRKGVCYKIEHKGGFHWLEHPLAKIKYSRKNMESSFKLFTSIDVIEVNDVNNIYKAPPGTQYSIHSEDEDSFYINIPIVADTNHKIVMTTNRYKKIETEGRHHYSAWSERKTIYIHI